jgi:transcriptional regulator with XRE-family HTH domain
MLVVMTNDRDDTDARRARIDARTHAITTEIESLRLKRGLSKAELARRSGVHPTQISQILLGHQGMSLERLSDILEVLGAAMLITEADELHAPSIGHINSGGEVVPASADQRMVFPCYVETSTSSAEFSAGERLFIKESSVFQVDKWMLCRRGAQDLEDWP